MVFLIQQTLPTAQAVGRVTFTVKLLRNIELGRNVDLIGNVFSVFLPLSHTLGEQIFDLTVHRAKIILRPRGNGGVELGGEAQRDLFFLTVVHISTSCPS